MLSKDRIGALLLLVFCAAYWMLAYDIRMLPFQRTQAFNAQTMPIALGVLGTALALLLLIFPGSNERVDVKGYRFGTGAIMLVLMTIYGFTIRTLGFIPSTTLFLMAGYWVLGEKRPLVLILASLPLVVAFWVLMTQGLDIYVAPFPSFLEGGGNA